MQGKRRSVDVSSTEPGPPGGRAPTRGAPTVWFMWARTHGGEGTHKGVPLRLVYVGALTWGEGTHKGCPYGLVYVGACSWGGGHPQGVPLRLVYVGALTWGEGTHKGCPYGWLMWARSRGGRTPTRGAPTVGLCGRAHVGGGHPQGVPLRLVYVGAHTWGEGTHKGLPLRLVYVGAHTWGEGTHKGCPYGWFTWARTHGGRAPTRGAPTVGLCGRAHVGGGHPQGVPLRLDDEGARTGGGHPQGVPLRLVNVGALMWGEGTHKGCPYGWLMWARSCGGGHPQGVPLRVGLCGRAHVGGGRPQGVPLRLGPETSATVGGVSRCLNQDLQKLRIIRMAASLSLPIQRIHLASIKRGVGREAADRDRWGVYGDLTRPIIAAMMGRGGCGPVPA